MSSPRKAGKWGASVAGRILGRLRRYAVSPVDTTVSFDPTSLSLSGYWRASYSGAPWVGTASSGASSGRNMVTNGAPLTTGTAVNGFTPATDNRAKGLKCSTTLSNLVTSTAGSGWVLFNPTASAASGNMLFSDASGTFSPDCLIVQHDDSPSSHNVNVNIDFTTAGPVQVLSPTNSVPNGSWALVQWTFSNTTVRVRINGGAWTTTTIASDTMNSIASSQTCDIGDSSAGGGGYTGDMLECAVSNTIISDANFDNVRTFLNTRYALSI